MPRKSSNGRSVSDGKGHVVEDCMTPDPIALLELETVAVAAQAMRDNDIGDVIVLDDTGARVMGLLTDRDIVIRDVAEERDPLQTTIGSVCSGKVMCVRPDDSLDKVVKLMRDRAIRRVPVVDETERPVGILSIGDLAQQLDNKSVLAGISAAKPDR